MILTQEQMQRGVDVWNRRANLGETWRNCIEAAVRAVLEGGSVYQILLPGRRQATLIGPETFGRRDVEAVERWIAFNRDCFASASPENAVVPGETESVVVRERL